MVEGLFSIRIIIVRRVESYMIRIGNDQILWWLVFVLDFLLFSLEVKGLVNNLLWFLNVGFPKKKKALLLTIKICLDGYYLSEVTFNVILMSYCTDKSKHYITPLGSLFSIFEKFIPVSRA